MAISVKTTVIALATFNVGLFRLKKKKKKKKEEEEEEEEEGRAKRRVNNA